MNRKKILIIDKNAQYRTELKGAGYQTLEVGDGHDAMELIFMAKSAGKDFDLIIADMMLLDLSSVPDFMKMMKEGGISTPVCAVSSSRNNMTNLELLYAGCSAFISDPVEPARLLEFVDDILHAPP